MYSASPTPPPLSTTPVLSRLLSRRRGIAAAAVQGDQTDQTDSKSRQVGYLSTCVPSHTPPPNVPHTQPAQKKGKKNGPSPAALPPFRSSTPPVSAPPHPCIVGLSARVLCDVPSVALKLFDSTLPAFCDIGVTPGFVILDPDVPGPRVSLCLCLCLCNCHS